MNSSTTEVNRSRRDIAFALLVIGIVVVAVWALLAQPRTEPLGANRVKPNLKLDSKSPGEQPIAATKADHVVEPSGAPSGEPQTDPGVATTKTRPRANLVLVAEEQPQLIPIATPLVARLNADPMNTFMLVVRSPLPKADRDFITQLNPAKIYLLGVSDVNTLFEGDAKPEGIELIAGHTPYEVSAAVARKGWRQRDHAIIAPEGDNAAILLGSTLASHQKLPFLIVNGGTTGTKLSAALAKLKATQITACVSDVDQKPKWSKTLKQETFWLDRRAIQDAIVQTLGENDVKNIVLTRRPDTEAFDALSAWAAPYFAQGRRSALLLVDHADGFEAERQLYAFIHQHKLQPRSLTIVGDVSTIGGITAAINVPDTAQAGDFTFDVEPGMKPADGFAVSLAVGRFPFLNPSENVQLFTRGLARERLVGHRLPRMLMIANPNPAHGALPLAETVSRATSNEFKNLGVKVSEYYGTPTQEPQVREAAKHANLILYEGHLGDQHLFEDAGFFIEGDPNAFDPNMEPSIEGPAEFERPLLPNDGTDQHPARGPPEDGDEPRSDSSDLDASRQSSRDGLLARLNQLSEEKIAIDDVDNVTVPQNHPLADSNADPSQATDEPTFQPIDPNGFATPPFNPDDPNEEMAHRQLPPLELEGMPIVILQSCYSLADWVVRRISESGGVALVGSVTRIHSASGSTFIKAVGDNMLYQDMTLGEAVRDARNYYLCLQDLKDARGHQEQYKSLRVALSFRLWGDPELKMFPRKTAEAKRRTVSVRWTAANKLLIQTPGHRLAECKTERYVLRQHPSAQAAGLVNRKDTTQPGRILPIYYARLPLPEGFDPTSVAKFARAKDKTARASWRVDELGQYLHVIYFPQKDRSHAVYELEFHR